MRVRKLCLVILALAAMASPIQAATPSDLLGRAWVAVLERLGVGQRPPFPSMPKGGGCLDPLGKPATCPVAETPSALVEGGGCLDPLGRPIPCQ